MISAITVQYDQLPANVKSEISTDRFLYAYYLEEKHRYVIRTVTNAGQIEELEYDPQVNRFLSLKERLSELPGPTERVMKDRGVIVKNAFYIDTSSNQVRVKFVIESISNGEVIVAFEKALYHPIKWDADTEVATALKKTNFPSVYQTWEPYDKALYWANIIHRFRRANGEMGYEEDDVFAEDLLKDFEKVDPNVRELMISVLSLVARLEQTEPEEMIQRFKDRVPSLKL